MPYQVDFATADGGKRIKASKRYARWVVGFCNKEAVEAGKTGAACRGEEHEIVLSLSVISGKNSILIDGEVVLNVEKAEENIEYRDYLEGQTMDLVVYLNENERPKGAPLFALSINGVPFFSLPKIFELGTPKASSNPANRRNPRRRPKVSTGEGGTRRRTIDA